MIGVIAPPSRRAAVQEFFELFKTPWEFHRQDGAYDVLVSSTGELPSAAAPLTLVFGKNEGPSDIARKIHVNVHGAAGVVRRGEDRIPIHVAYAHLQGAGAPLLVDELAGKTVALAQIAKDHIFVRIGYDIFEETEILLGKGQSSEQAATPTLDLHIAFFRDVILNAGLPLTEVPPIPAGYEFTVCLTHDVDHPSIRFHRFDHTIAGFLRRAFIDSAINAAKGRLTFRKLLRNICAALKLPLVYLHLSKDFWLQFDRYLQIEHGLGSTFFVIPDKGKPGRALTGEGQAPPKRGSPYGIEEVASILATFPTKGCEIALHGIDAWADPVLAKRERERVAPFARSPETGVRMHWLYYDESSAANLEAGGFTYDSTIGFNDTIGYRSGTGQVFKPLTTKRLLELPLHIMDTALFYPTYLNLTDRQAVQKIRPMVEAAVRHGGALTLNWHDRSISPERLWDDCYIELISILRSQNPWFTTAANAVAWFRQRRMVAFESTTTKQPVVQDGQAVAANPSDMPAMRLRIHDPRRGLIDGKNAGLQSGTFSDFPLK